MESRDFSILDPDLELEKRIFLEASAGTGKTFAIEHFALRLILEKGMSVDEILIVTFTKKATSELRARLFSLIERAYAALTSEETFKKSLEELPYLKKLKDIKKARDHLYRNRLIFENASISTLHAFGLKALEKVDFDVCLKQEIESPKAFIKSFLSGRAQGASYNPYLLKKLMRSYGSSACFIDALTLMLSRSAHFAKMLPFSEVKERLKKELEVLSPPQTFEALIKDLQALGAEYKGILDRSKKLKPNLVEIVDALSASFISNVWDDEALSLFCEKAEPLVKLLSSSGKKKKEPSGAGPLNYFKALKNATKGLELYLFDPEVLLVQLAYDLRLVCAENKEARAVFSPDDILYALQAKLASPIEGKACTAKIIEPYKAVIIDEFQDTDPVQWDLFSRLFFKSKEQDLYGMLVGDPKQSIYGFRKADIYTFFEAKKIFGSKAAYYLTTNYRSDSNLTQSLNKLFALRKDGTFLHLPKTGERIVFVPSQSPKKHPNEDGHAAIEGPLECFLASIKGVPNLSAQEELIFPWIASRMLALRKEGISFCDMALLAKDRFQIEAIEAYLNRLDIPTKVEGDYSVSKDKVWLMLKAFAEALLFPHDRARLALALSLFGFEARLLLNEDFLKEKAQVFQSLLSVVHKYGFLTAASDWLKIYPIQEASAFYELADLLEQKRLEKRLLFSSLWNIQELFEAFEELLISKERTSKKGVRLTTIHKSKGLEYGYVFALGLVQRAKGLGKVMSSQGVITPSICVSEEEREMEIHELDAEKLRAFYVALTRAKHRAYLPVLLSEKEPAFGTASCNEVFFNEAFSLDKEVASLSKDSLENYVIKRLQKVGAKVTLASKDSFFENDLNSSQSFSELDRANVSAELISKRANSLENASKRLESCFSKNIQTLSYSSITGSASLEEKIKIRPSESEVPAGPKVGIWIHEVLRVLLESGAYQNLNENTFERACARFVPSIFFEKYKALLFEWVKNALENPLPEIGPLKDIEWKDLLIEQPFMWRISNESSDEIFIKGIIDLVVHVDGKLYIIDWKSNYLEDYSQSELEKAMHHHGYFIQASLYRAALEKMVWPWEQAHFAQAHYVFLRGGSFSFEPRAFSMDKLLFKTEEAACHPL